MYVVRNLIVKRYMLIDVIRKMKVTLLERAVVGCPMFEIPCLSIVGNARRTLNRRIRRYNTMRSYESSSCDDEVRCFTDFVFRC